jgi:glycosyltransferase involved in cell wall biosynthesis
MRVQIVDPPAYTPPYDRSLCAALARAGVEVELVTSPFLHGRVPVAEGYEVSEQFYLSSAKRGLGARARRPRKAAEHLADMLRFRRSRTNADITHYQWVGIAALDWLMLPGDRPQVLTAHGSLRGGQYGKVGWGFRRTFDRMDTVIALSEHGARILRDRIGLPPDRVRMIPHAVLDYPTRLPDERPLPPELAGVEGPVVLFFGLVRPYKGVDVLLQAFRQIEDAELWIVGRPFGVEPSELEALAAASGPGVRFVPRFVDDSEIPALFRRATVVALPFRDAEQSGVLYTSIAFGKATVVTDVGGFAEVAAEGAARLVPPENPEALAAALTELLTDREERERLEASTRAAAEGLYSWDTVAAQHLALYRELA